MVAEASLLAGQNLLDAHPSHCSEGLHKRISQALTSTDVQVPAMLRNMRRDYSLRLRANISQTCSSCRSAGLPPAVGSKSSDCAA